MVRWIGILSDKLNKVGGALGGIFILVMGIIVTYEVMMRYVFRAPTTWVLEISIYLTIGSVFLGGGYALKEKMHISVDVITRHFSQRNQVLLQIMCLFITGIYCVVLTWFGAEMALTSLRLGEVSTTVLEIPVVIPHSFVPIGGVLILLEVIRQILEGIGDLRKTSRGKGNWLARNLPPVLFLILSISSAALFYSPQYAPLGLVLLIFILIFGGAHIAFSLGMMGLIGFYLTFGGGPLLNQVPMVTYKILDDFIIAAVPLFISLAAVLSVGKIGASLYNFAGTMVRHLPGGLGVATIMACTVFAAMCGSSVATVATIGLIAIPEMLSRGYDRKLVFGTVTIGGVLGPLIPPSIFFILIGAITGDSVGKLFMAGMLPGIMLAVLFSSYIIIKSLRNKALAAKVEPASWKERREAFKQCFWGLMAPVIILGGIYTGVFTPTEAAGVGMVYSLLICAFIYRTLPPKELWRVILDGGKLTATLLFIVTGAIVFGQLITMLKIPEGISAFLAGLPLSKMTILFLILFFVLILGALMDEGAILLITYPILYHIFVTKFGFDSIWFALVFVFTLEVGLVAPPVAINIFTLMGIWNDAKYDEVVKGVLPFIIIMVSAILLVVYIRPLSLWLPSLIG